MNRADSSIVMSSVVSFRGVLDDDKAEPDHGPSEAQIAKRQARIEHCKQTVQYQKYLAEVPKVFFGCVLYLFSILILHVVSL